MLTRFYPTLAPIQGPSSQCKDTLSFFLCVHAFFKKSLAWLFKKESKESSRMAVVTNAFSNETSGVVFSPAFILLTP